MHQFEDSINNKICRFIHLHRFPRQTQHKLQIFKLNLGLYLDSLHKCNLFLTIMINNFNAKSKQWCEIDKTSFEHSQLQFRTFNSHYNSNFVYRK